MKTCELRKDRPSTLSRSTAATAVLATLFLSGAASLINETVWQRALKVYLAGSEAISAMIVVLVFMLGLGAGSLLMGLIAHRLRRPLLFLAALELSLSAAGFLLAVVLSRDIGDSIYSVQRLGVSVGLPLQVVYGLSAAAVLLIPCVIMGMTLPLVSEVFQRQFAYQNPAFVAVLFFVSTGGAVVGSVAAAFVLLPCVGQYGSLLGAAAGNAAAGLTLFAIHGRQPPPPVTAEAAVGFGSGGLRPEEILGFALGFLSLAYEMYMFRAVAVAHRPLPYNFGLALSCYLFFWSLGAYLSKRSSAPLGLLLSVAAAAISVIPAFHVADLLYSRRHTMFGADPVYVSVLVYAAPCILFGWLFGATVARVAHRWGNDVGRFYGLNTIGSCLGILAMTFVGYEFNHAYAALGIAVGYLGLGRYIAGRLRIAPLTGRRKHVAGVARLAVVANVALLVPAFVVFDKYPSRISAAFGVPSKVVYYGKGGVIEVSDKSGMTWDGLWHSALSVKGNHVGTSNWMLATVPFLCHGGRRIERALVIGVGTGITLGTLARSGLVDAVDAYETNTMVRRLLDDYREGTLRTGFDRKVSIRWQDGRAGLALNSTQYELITQQPLWLIQAGSSFLLSREYFQLVSRRLKPGGVFCIYSHTFGGNQAQARLVRKTAASVFRHTESFGNGYMIVASQTPFEYSWRLLEDWSRTDPLIDEMRGYGPARMAAYQDAPDDAWMDYPFIITDNHPLVEYPWAAQALAHRSSTTLTRSSAR